MSDNASDADEEDRKLFEGDKPNRDDDELPSDEDLLEDDEDDSEDEEDQEDDDEDDRDRLKRKGSKLKGKKPSKKRRKNRRNQVDDMFDEEAEQSDNDEQHEQQPEDAEIKAQEARKRIQQYYNKPRSNQPGLFDDIEGKNEEEIERMFRERSYNQYSAENSCPSPEDPCVFMVPVKNGREDAIVLQILNKAAKMRSDKERKMNIISAISLKRRFSGYIFVEVRREKDANKSMLTVKKALEGMYDVFLGRVSQLKDEDYEKLFRERQQVTSSIRKDDYVRIKGGLYDEDLGKVYEVKKKSFDVTLVPRINIQEIQTRIKDLREKHENSEDRDKIISKAFKKYFDYREPRDLNRPPRRPTFGNELPDIRDVTHLKLTKDGFIILNFTGEELSQQLKTVMPKEISFFNKGDENNGQFMQKELQHFHNAVSISRGDEVEIAYGDTKGLVGKVKEIRGNIATIEITKKNLGVDCIEEPVEKLTKRFKIGQHVKIVAGNDKGRTGMILKIEQRQAIIFTENENQIKVLVNNLIIWNGPSSTSEESREQFKKFELIKTINGVGIVLVASKDTLKILDINNSIKVISVLDFDSKLDTRKMAAKNTYNEIIKNGAIVRIISGTHSGKRCEVKHVYKDMLFLYNIDIYQSSSITVENVNNCILVTPSSEIKFTRPVYGNNSQQADNTNKARHEDPTQEELQIGKTITIKGGEFKGYQGSIVNNNGANIAVRLTAKGKVVNVSRDHIVTIKKTNDIGKTPRVSASTYAAQSPAAWNESRHERNHNDDA